jgi:hypothetical protein
VATDSKPKLTPEEVGELRAEARRKRILMRAAEKVYGTLSEDDQRRIDDWAHEKGKSIVRDRGVPVDGPRFGPPWGIFWSLVATERDRLWHERLLNDYGHQVYATMGHADHTTEWLNNDKPPRIPSEQQLSARLESVVSMLGALTGDLKPRPRPDGEDPDAWTEGRE